MRSTASRPPCARADGRANRLATADRLGGARVTPNAQIVGVVEYREGDGANIRIPPGPCEVVLTALDATISWQVGDWRGSTAIPLSDFRRFVARKALRMVDAPMAEAGIPHSTPLKESS